MSADDVLAWEQWRQARTRALTAVPGNLSLVSYQAVTADPAPLDQVPTVTVRRSPGRDGAVLQVPTTADVRLDGRRVSGEVFVGPLRADGGPLLASGRWRFDVFTLDGSEYELRVYDEQAPNLARFTSVEAYPYDPEWVLDGVFVEHAATASVPWGFTRATDAGHTKRVPGTVEVTIAGVEHQLVAFLDGEELVIVFADGTTGAGSYAPGRFARISRPAHGGVVLDLNRAFIPPCGFSDSYSCPLPPAENRISAPVTAGEKRVVWGEGTA